VAQFTKDYDHARYVFHGPYNPLVPEAIKRLVPFPDREYDPGTHEWFFDEVYFVDVLNAVRMAYAGTGVDVEVEE